MDSRTAYQYKKSLGLSEINKDAAELVCARDKKLDAYNFIVAAKKSLSELEEVVDGADDLEPSRLCRYRKTLGVEKVNVDIARKVFSRHGEDKKEVYNALLAFQQFQPIIGALSEHGLEGVNNLLAALERQKKVDEISLLESRLADLRNSVQGGV